MAYIGNTAETQGFIPAVDFFSGNGSTTAFTLSRPVASVAQVQATIENVPQNPGTAFTVSGNTITFDGAPASGTNNIYVYYTSPITQVIQPGQGTVGTAQIQSGVTVSFADGSAASPSITNLDDSNTGMFFPAADTIAFAEGGVEAMRLDASGNVGIGTSSPAAKLQLSGGAAQNQFFVNTSTSVGSKLGGSYFYSSNTNDGWYSGIDSFVTAGSPGIDRTDLRFYTTSVTAQERMRLTSGGDLQFNSGYGSVATAYGCRAWVCFKGDGTVAIQGAGNVSSVTDIGLGSYQVNFATTMVDTNYACVMGQQRSGTSDFINEGFNRGTNSTRVETFANGSGADFPRVQLAFFR